MNNTTPTVTLGGVQYPVREMPLGVLRPAMRSFTLVGAKLASQSLDDECMEHIGIVVAAGLKMTYEQFAEIPLRLDELLVAFQVCADVSGLIPKEGGAPLGEALTGKAGTGTTFTPSSSSTPD